MRCLVTGVAGFVGSHLAERLLMDGHEVSGIDAFIDYYPRMLKERNLEQARQWDTFSFTDGDLLQADLKGLLAGVDWVFHQAAQAGVRASWGNEFLRYADCNVLATQRLLEAAMHSRTLRRFVYASSSSVYGNVAALPVLEETLAQPVSPYGVTKLAAEHLCTLYHKEFNVPTVSLRYFTVYGPRQRPDMAFHRFCRVIVNNEDIQIFSDGQQTRDFTYIADVIEANIGAATSEAAVGQVMNIAGGSRVTIQHVLQLLQHISGRCPRVRYEARQPGDVLDIFADTRQARKLIAYNPTFSLVDGLVAEFEYISRLYGSVRV